MSCGYGKGYCICTDIICLTLSPGKDTVMRDTLVVKIRVHRVAEWQAAASREKPTMLEPRSMRAQTQSASRDLKRAQDVSRLWLTDVSHMALVKRVLDRSHRTQSFCELVDITCHGLQIWSSVMKRD
jgi:hypothetical protein